MTTQLARAAVWYARHGWTIFPLRPRTKEPFGGSHGAYDGTNDVDRVMDLWRRQPNANIGLHCGGCGLLAIDLDKYKDTYNGHGVLTRDDEETVTNLTGSGGTHLLYKLEEGEKYGNQKGNLPEGVDIRGWGGYIVLPPSIHPNGNAYQWEEGYGPHQIAVAPLPEKLREILRSARTGFRVPGPASIEAVAIGQMCVESLLVRLDLATFPVKEYDNGGRKWILKQCPFQPAGAPHDADGGAYIVVARDGVISAGCHHERCRNALRDSKTTGWKWLLRQKKVEHA